MLPINQIADFWKQLYFERDGVNQSDILHADRNSANFNSDFKIFGMVSSSILWVNQASRFISKAHTEMEPISKCNLFAQRVTIDKWNYSNLEV